MYRTSGVRDGEQFHAAERVSQEAAIGQATLAIDVVRRTPRAERPSEAASRMARKLVRKAFVNGSERVTTTDDATYVACEYAAE